MRQTDSCQDTITLTEAIKREIETETEVCPTLRCACIEALQIVQRHHGWVSDDSLKSVADFLGMTVEELDSIATFYNRIYRKPVGRHIILVCDSVSCWIMGFEHIRNYLEQRLSIKLGETTPDGRFTLLPIQCLGACDQAPAMMIDDELYGNLGPEKIERILENHK